MRYDHTPLEELGKTRRPRKVRVPLVTPVQDKFKALSKKDQNTCKVLYKQFTSLTRLPIPAQWQELDVKMEWSMHLFKLLHNDFRVRVGSPDMFDAFMEWLTGNPLWVKEIWLYYKRGKNAKYKNPCAKFCGEFDWIAMDYYVKQKIWGLQEKEALEKAEKRNSPSREAYMLPKIEDHPEIEIPDDGNEYYLVRAFGGKIEARIKPQNDKPRGRHRSEEH